MKNKNIENIENDEFNNKYHNDISSEMKKRINKTTENFINSLMFGTNIKKVDNEILTLIENPFMDVKNNDALSMIYHKFWKYTDVPVALPIFAFLSFVSAHCVFSKATYQIPYDKKKHLNTWVMALAPSGANKTMSFNIINDLIPSFSGEKVVQPNFIKPDGPKAMVQQLADNKEGLFFWFEDEASQFFKQIEQAGSPLSSIKGDLLKLKDGAKITRKNAKEEIIADGSIMTQFFINTIDSMAKSISDESMNDGLVRRYQFVVSDKEEDPKRHFTKHPLYKLDEIRFDENLEKTLIKLFKRDINEADFTFNDDCIKLFEDCFELFWFKEYQFFMEGSENIYRTYMLEAWKYAVFHHIINNLKGFEVSAKSLQWGLKVSLFLLNSFKKFITYRAEGIVKNPLEMDKKITRLNEIILYVQQNENKEKFILRDVYRKFNTSKADIISILKSYKKANPKFESVLYKQIK